MTHKIIYTKVDEAPALATYSFLPILQAYTKDLGIALETRDISLVGRIIANFPEKLTEEQKIPDHLAELGGLTQDPGANIIKLPNISASIPQLKGALKELQEKGYDIPDYPEEAQTDEERELQKRFAKVLGSAVNPVLRQGNSDRRAPVAVKKFAQKFPQSMGLPLKDWSSDCQSHVAYMATGDFYESENATTVEKAMEVRIEFMDQDGKITLLKENFPLLEGEVIDTSVMRVGELDKFFEKQIADAKEQGLLLSLHLKATMMKVSDPIMFGHAVSVYYRDVFEKHRDTLKELGVNPNNGMGDLYSKIQKLPQEKREEIKKDIEEVYNHRPKLAMVDSSKGITNLHVPSDVIIDASMPVVVRDGGKMWGPDNQLHDTKALIPDRCYATIYWQTIEDCKANGAFDRATMGNVANVGLMAQKAEEYGSHDKTFEAVGAGTIRVVTSEGEALLEQTVEEGDIFRMCQAKDEPIRDWIKLAVKRARATGVAAIFWLDKNRGHDGQIIAKVEKYLPDHDTSGLDIRIMAPMEAMKFSLTRIRKGEDTISVTGNVLRDYLTDLFPILELGSSAKMLSIVPLLKGGGLFETGAGGSAPKHVQQFLKEGHLRWDSLGEYGAMMASFEHIGLTFGHQRAGILSRTLDQAIARYLENKKWPSRKVNELDNRGSNFYIALYWAQCLAEQNEDEQIKTRFAKVAKELEENREKIENELLSAQGSPVDMGGYYLPDDEKAGKAMRPSPTFNGIIDSM